MAKMSIDNEGLIIEPCLSCEKSYMEDIWNEWCCDEKECPYESEGNTEHQLRQVLLRQKAKVEE